MSKLANISKIAVHAMIGLSALSSGNIASGALRMLTVIDLGRAIGARDNSANSKIEAAIKQTQAALEKSTEFKNANFDRLETLLKDEDFTIDCSALIDQVKQSNGKNLALMIKKIYFQALKFDGDSQQDKSAMAFLLQAAANTLVDLDAFQQTFTMQALVALLQDNQHKNQQLNNLKEILEDKLKNALVLEQYPKRDAVQQITFLALSFNERATDYIGRQDDIAKIKGFLEEQKSLCWWQVAGIAGQGKSRIGLEIVDRLNDQGWNAGFLTKDKLEKTDWDKVDFFEPTLILIDYLSVETYIERFVKALCALNERLYTLNHSHKLDAARHKIRFLVLEREPYDHSNQNPQNWYKYILSDQKRAGSVRDLAHKDKALILADLSEENMLAIADSWLEQRQKPALNEEQKNKLLGLLGNEKKSAVHQRAWRPLFAMLFAEQLDHVQSGKDFDVYHLLIKIIQQEQKTYWSNKGTINIKVKRLAALATILGTVELSAIEAKEDYGLLSKALISETYQLLGYNLSFGDFDALPESLQARTPDLLGEALVLFCLSGFSEEPEKIHKVINHAFTINIAGFIDFWLRLNQDFPDHAVTQLIADTPFDEDNIKSFIKISRGFPLIVAAELGLLGCAKQHLDQGVEITDKVTGFFPLLMAAYNGHDKVVKLLLDKGENVNQERKQNGTSPLLLAAHQGHDKVIKLLLDKGENVNQEHKQSGVFPLLQAAQNGHDKVVKLLLDQGADFNKENQSDGVFPLLMAAQNGHDKVVKLLLEKRACVDKENKQTGAFPLLMAAQNGHDKVVKLLLDHDADFNKVQRDGIYPLLLAAMSGHDKVAQLLLEYNASVDKVHAETGLFPLYIAAQQGHAKIVEHLLKKGASVDKVHAETGVFPLYMAVQEGHDEVVELLLVYNASVDRVWEKHGIFPLYIAAQQGHAKIVEHLLKKGADVHKTVNNQGNEYTALDIARHTNHHGVVAILEAWMKKHPRQK